LTTVREAAFELFREHGMTTIFGNPGATELLSPLYSAVLVGFPAAEKYLNFDGHPSEIYVRTVRRPPSAGVPGWPPGSRPVAVPP
jgi:hypothetical protein